MTKGNWFMAPGWYIFIAVFNVGLDIYDHQMITTFITLFCILFFWWPVYTNYLKRFMRTS